jgi:hypothetical protein
MNRPFLTLNGAYAAAIVVALARWSSGCDSAEPVPAGSSDGSAPSLADTAPDGSAGARLVAAALSADLGAVAVGTRGTSYSLTFSNQGGVATGPLAASLAGANGGEYGLDSDGCSGHALAAGATCVVSTYFAPTLPGTSSASLLLAAAPGGTVAVSLTGTGLSLGPLAIVPSSADFGAVAGGESSPKSVFTLTGSGGEVTASPSIVLTGQDASFFAISDDGCSGQPLPPAGCVWSVTFSPPAGAPIGPRSASITATVAGAVATATLSASVASPATLAVDPGPTFDFGPLALGAPAPEQTFTVTNDGGTASLVPTVAVTGTGSLDFSVDENGCTAPLAPGETCTFTLGFDPATAGTSGATVTVSAGSATPASVAVTGQGLAAAAIAVTPATQSFGVVTQASRSSAATFVVTNGGDVPSGPLTLSLAGTEANQFVISSDTCTMAQLAPSATCSVAVAFAPAPRVSGAVAASLQVSGAPGGQAVASLTGTAVAPAALDIEPTSQDFGTLVSGATSSATFTITNAGGQSTGPIAVQLSAPDGFAIAGDACSGTTLAGGATCTVFVTFAPSSTTTGPQAANLQVTAAPGGSLSASLTGTAQQPAALSLIPPPGFSGFGTVVDGNTSATADFVLMNGGGQATGVLTTSLGGPAAGSFAVTSDACNGTVLGAGARCTVSVQFAPSIGASGSQRAVLDAQASPGGSTSAALSGTAKNPASLSISGPALIGGLITVVPPATASGTFTVTNGGDLPSGTITASIAQTVDGTFVIANDGCTGNVLAGGASCTLDVVFSPPVASSGLELCLVSVSASPGGSASTATAGNAGTPADAGGSGGDSSASADGASGGASLDAAPE